jgi:site-specific DNA-cytosine methylase
LREFGRQTGLEYTTSNAYDIDKRLKVFYEKLGNHDGPDQQENFAKYKLGTPEGDVMLVGTKDVDSSDGMVGGPSCQPFSSQGKRQAADDDRSDVYMQVVRWVIALALRGVLLFFLLENSCNVAASLNGKPRFVDVILKKLREALPFFVVDYHIMDLQTILPHRRERLWLRGMRIDALNGHAIIPDPIKAPKVTLRSMLTPNLPNVNRKEQLTRAGRANLIWYEEQIAADVMAKNNKDICVVDLSRKQTSKFNNRKYYDVLPTLTTGGPALFLISTHDVGAPDESREFLRYLTLEERFAAQGHRKGFAHMVPHITAGRKATGNAFAVPMLGAILLPMLYEIAQSGLVVSGPLTNSALSPEAIVRLSLRASRLRRAADASVLGAPTTNPHDVEAHDVETIRGLIRHFVADGEASKRLRDWCGDGASSSACA